MPEPTTRRGRDTKERIVATAAALMYEHGVSATSIEDILAASDTGKSQFYHYFTSKDDLVSAVLQHQLDRILEDQQAYPLGTWSGLVAWFDALINAHEARFQFHGCPLGSIAGEVLEQGEPLRREAANTFLRWEASLSRELRVMRMRGMLRDNADPNVLAETT